MVNGHLDTVLCSWSLSLQGDENNCLCSQDWWLEGQITHINLSISDENKGTRHWCGRQTFIFFLYLIVDINSGTWTLDDTAQIFFQNIKQFFRFKHCYDTFIDRTQNAWILLDDDINLESCFIFSFGKEPRAQLRKCTTTLIILKPEMWKWFIIISSELGFIT